MAILNNHPYKTVKLSHNGVEREYSKINVNGQPVWRKPISYTRTLWVVSDAGTPITQDAIGDGAITFSFQHKVGNNWVDCSLPGTQEGGNDNLDNPNIIKYGDKIRFSYIITEGFNLHSIQCKIGNNTIQPNVEYEALNDITLTIYLGIPTYTLTINQDAGVHSSVIYRYAGIAGRLAGAGQGEPVNSSSTIYYGDRLVLFSKSINWGYSFKDIYFSQGYDTEADKVTGDVVVSIRTNLKTGVLNVTTSRGVSSWTAYRVVGQISKIQGLSDGYINNRDLIYAGDKITLNAIIETGYSSLNTYPITYNMDQEDNLNLNHYISASSNLYKVYIIRTGKFINPVNNTSAISNIKIDRVPGTIGTREGATSGNIYNSGVKNNDEYYAQVYYGDTLTINYIVQDIYKPIAQQVITAPDEDLSITVNLEVKNFTISIVQNTGVDSLTVTRTSSPYQEADTGVLSNNDTIYYGDTLKVEAVAGDGYTLNEYSKSITVVGNTTIAPTTSIKVHHLYIDNTPGITTVTIGLITSGINPERSATSTLYKGSCLNDSTVPYCDVYYKENLHISAQISTGYYGAQIHYKGSIGNYIDIYDEDALVSITTHPVERRLQILGKEGITGIKLTCLSAGIGPHTVNEVLYDGDVMTDGNSYSTVYYNEIIKVEYYTHEAYNTLSPDTITVLTENVKITKNSTVKTYAITSVKNNGISNLVIKRTYRKYPSEDTSTVTLANEDILNYGDSISVVASPSTGYLVDNYTSLYENISSDLTISPTAHKIYGTLVISKGTGVSNITVTRNNVSISDGTTIYFGNVLDVSATSSTGYTLDNFTSSNVFTPSVDGETLTVIVTAHPTEHTLHLNVDYSSIASYSVERKMTGVNPDAPKGQLADGDTIYYQDKLYISYTAKKNYVVGSGYDTSYNYIATCDNSDKTIDMVGTYTATLTIFQRGANNKSLDYEDIGELKVNYPDNPDTTVSYNANKRVRVDQKVKLYPSNQTLNTNLPSISKVLTDNEEVNLINNSYYELNPNSRYYINLQPRQIVFKVRSTVDKCNTLKPEIVNASVLVDSKYTNNSGSKYAYVYDYNYHTEGQVYEYNITAYYKDTITPYSPSNISGFTYNGMNITWDGGSINIGKDEDPKTYNIDLTSDNYLLTILYKINSYVLKYTAEYCKTNLYINDVIKLENQKFESDTFTYNVYYGSTFYKECLPYPNNSPMDRKYYSHENNLVYTVKGDVQILDGYYNNLVSPSLSVEYNMGVNQYNEDEINFKIGISNSNSPVGYPYNIVLRIYKNDTLIENFTYTSSESYILKEYTISIGSGNTSYPVFKFECWVEAKLVADLYREKSNTTILTIDPNDTGEEETTTTQ